MKWIQLWNLTELEYLQRDDVFIMFLAYLPFTWKNRKFRLGNQMVRAIPFGKRQKMWAVICSDAIFLLLLVCSADFDILCSGLFSHHVKFYSFMFMHRISTRVVCINIKRPWSLHSL